MNILDGEFKRFCLYLFYYNKAGVRFLDGRRLYTATCGIRTKCPSRIRTSLYCHILLIHLGLIKGLDARLAELEVMESNNAANQQTKKVASDYMWEELYSYIDVSQDISDDIKAGL